MNHPSGPVVNYSSQHSIQAKCFHPSGTFVEFKKEEIEQSIPDRFEQMVRMYPGRLAVKTRTRELTYGELNKAANRVARTILAQRGEREEPIALLLDDDAAIIAAVMGVLKAGKFYVPLDPTYPTERLAYILDSSQATAIITNNRDAVTAKTLVNGTLQSINIDEIDVDVSTTNPNVSVSPETLAYILYTSGSTGQPKGVMQNHRNVLHFIRVYTNNLHISSDDRLTLFSSYSHDAAIVDIFAALLNGATLCPGNIKENGLCGLDKLLISEKTTIYHSTPTLYRNFVDTLDQKIRFPNLRAVVLGGEELFKGDFVRFRQHFSQGCILFNLYGSTESTINLLHSLKIQAEVTQNALPIGYPVEDTEVLLLNEAGKRAETYGEIGIRSPHVSLGYWQKPEMNKDVFLTDPDGGVKRLYRTGDMGRLLPGGSIQFIGRKDFQVKIRGFRVELGEMEAVLGQYPAVREAVVLAREDEPGDPSAPLRAGKCLVAYVVPRQEQTPTISQLHSFLKQKLPNYMVPSAFVFLDALPLTPNGKVDRLALPVPGTDRPELAATYIKPQTEMEQYLAQIWGEILGIDKIGIHDNFFELGGNSLKGAMLINRIQADLSEYVYIVALFDAPTIADFGNYLNKHYLDAVSRMCGAKFFQGVEHGHKQDEGGSGQSEKVDCSKVTKIRQLITPLLHCEEISRATGSKNPAVIFILTPPRSGSTLLRVMLGGHPRVFAPPTLELLSFNTLKERKTNLSSVESYRLEGTIRAIMEIKSCEVEQANKIMTACEKEELSTKEFYRLLQEWIEPKILVDKSTFYALDLEALRRAENDFEDALYIHLLRHPSGMIHSFEEARLDQVFFRGKHSYSVREIAELTWLICHQNILEFLQGVPTHRQYKVKFEELVNQPAPIMEGICQFLGLEMNSGMLQPYKDKERKMTDGIHPVPESRMLGDARFHEHSDIDKRVADKWMKHNTDDFLGDITWQLAESLGYKHRAKLSEKLEGSGTPSSRKGLMPVQPVLRARIRQTSADLLLTKLDQLSGEEVDILLNDLLREERVSR